MEEYVLQIILVPSVIWFFPTDLFRVLLQPNITYSNLQQQKKKITQHEISSLHPKLKTDFCTQLHKQETDSRVGQLLEVYLRFSCAFTTF